MRLSNLATLSLAALILAPAAFAVQEGNTFRLAPPPVPAPGIDLERAAVSNRSFLGSLQSNHSVRLHLEASTGTLQSLSGPLSAPKAGDPASIAREFLGTKLGLPVATAGARTLVATDELLTGVVHRTTESSHVNFVQQRAGKSVYGSQLAVHLDAAGRVAHVDGAFHEYPETDGARWTLGADAAIAAARGSLKVTDLRADAGAKAVWADVQGQLKPAYQVSLPAAAPLGDFEVVVDATSGDVLGGTNQMCHATGNGKVYEHSPLTGDPISVALNNLDGSNTPSGAYVKVINDDGAVATSPDRQFNFEPTDTHFDEVMVYHHLNKVHDYFNTLGYHDRDKPIKATVHYGTAYDNAFFSPMSDSLAFGDGNKLNPLSREDNVMYHEYSHAVAGTITNLSGAEGGAMNEGFADYFAGSINEDTKIGVYIMKKLGKPWLRNMDNAKHYPEDIQGEVHADGEIWGAVCWDVRKAFGKEYADKLLHKSLYYLGSRPGFAKGCQGAVLAEQSLSGGSNKDKVLAIFAARGIKPPAAEPAGASQALAQMTNFLGLGSID